MKTILFIYGTRPEDMKMALLVREKEYYAIDDNSLFNFHKDAGSCERVFKAITERFGKQNK